MCKVKRRERGTSYENVCQICSMKQPNYDYHFTIYYYFRLFSFLITYGINIITKVQVTKV